MKERGRDVVVEGVVVSRAKLSRKEGGLFANDVRLPLAGKTVRRRERLDDLARQ